MRGSRDEGCKADANGDVDAGVDADADTDAASRVKARVTVGYQPSAASPGAKGRGQRAEGERRGVKARRIVGAPQPKGALRSDPSYHGLSSERVCGGPGGGPGCGCGIEPRDATGMAGERDE